MPALLSYGLRRIITQSPTVVTAVRETRGTDPDTGGRLTTRVTLPPVSCRIEPLGMVARELVTAGIDVERLSDWVLLAPPEADFRASETITETFVVPQGSFRLRRVIPLDQSGFICPLERVERA